MSNCNTFSEQKCVGSPHCEHSHLKILRARCWIPCLHSCHLFLYLRHHTKPFLAPPATRQKQNRSPLVTQLLLWAERQAMEPVDCRVSIQPPDVRSHGPTGRTDVDTEIWRDFHCRRCGFQPQSGLDVDSVGFSIRPVPDAWTQQSVKRLGLFIKPTFLHKISLIWCGHKQLWTNCK